METGASRTSTTSSTTTLVLIHGAGANGAFWDDLVPWLDGLDVLAPSLPGRGDGRPPCPTARSAAEALLSELDAHGIERAVLVGHSYGGAVALEAALSGDARVAGLVLIATGARLRVHPMILEVMAAAVTAGHAPPLGRAWFRPDCDAAMIERAAVRMSTVPPETALADWRASDAFDCMADLARIRMPTTVVSGSADTLTPPKYADFLTRGIQGARRVSLEGGGHFLPLEQPQATAAILRECSGAPAMSGS